MMIFSTAIFDMDGTLFDSERIALDCWQATFREFGVQVPREELEQVIGVDGKGTREFLSRFVPTGFGFDDLMLHARAIRKVYIDQHGLPMKPGAVELLSFLRDRGTKLGLATTTHAERTLENLNAANIADYFQVVVCGDQVERCKPFPDIYLKALADLGAAPDEAIALEDSVHGIQAAHAAGLRVIHIPDIKRIDEDTRGLVHRQYDTLLEFRDEIAFT
jgi:HAD superfamily hydrolase (TIGR01509 family)